MRIEMPARAHRSPTLSEAVEFANRLLQGEGHFLEEVSSIPSFLFSKNRETGKPVTGPEVVSALARNILATVRTYTPWYRSKACGGVKRRTTIIRLNTQKLDRPIEELVATLIHECVHIADNRPALSFGHGNNEPLA